LKEIEGKLSEAMRKFRCQLSAPPIRQLLICFALAMGGRVSMASSQAFIPFSELVHRSAILARGTTSPSNSPDEIRFEVQELFKGPGALHELRLKSEFPPQAMQFGSPEKVPLGKSFLLLLSTSSQNHEPYAFFTLYPVSPENFELRYLPLVLSFEKATPPPTSSIRDHIPFTKLSVDERNWLMSQVLEDKRVPQAWRDRFVENVLLLPGPPQGATFEGRDPSLWFHRATTQAWIQHFETHQDRQTLYPFMIFQRLKDPSAFPYLVHALEELRIEADANRFYAWTEALEASDPTRALDIYQALLESDIFPSANESVSSGAEDQIRGRLETFKTHDTQRAISLSPSLSAEALRSLESSFSSLTAEKRSESLARVALEAAWTPELDKWLLEIFEHEKDSNLRSAAIVARGLLLGRAKPSDAVAKKAFDSFVDIFAKHEYPERHFVARALARWASSDSRATTQLAETCQALGSSTLEGSLAEFCAHTLIQLSKNPLKASDKKVFEKLKTKLAGSLALKSKTNMWFSYALQAIDTITDTAPAAAEPKTTQIPQSAHSSAKETPRLDLSYEVHLSYGRAPDAPRRSKEKVLLVESILKNNSSKSTYVLSLFNAPAWLQSIEPRSAVTVKPTTPMPIRRAPPTKDSILRLKPGEQHVFKNWHWSRAELPWTNKEGTELYQVAPGHELSLVLCLDFNNDSAAFASTGLKVEAFDTGRVCSEPFRFVFQAPSGK
jgi:hypothetical protein